MISPELLRRFAFFGFLDDTQLKALAMVAEEVKYDPGDTLIEANTPARKLFFLIEGSVSYYAVVTSENSPDYSKEYYISNINPGEVFGISALIEPYQYTATLRADDPCRVLHIDAIALRAMSEADDKFAKGMLAAVARVALERLQSTRLQLVAAQV